MYVYRPASKINIQKCTLKDKCPMAHPWMCAWLLWLPIKMFLAALFSTMFCLNLVLLKGWDRQHCTSAKLRKAPFFTLRSFFKPLFLWQFHMPIKPATNQILMHLPSLLISRFVQHTYKSWGKKSLVSVIWLLPSLISFLFFNSKNTISTWTATLS